ncbi:MULTISPECIES: amino acid ABC transporter permease [Bifidobacterium]|jgi:polar amino acid transport system permease protein|uniref:Amino acid ABC transporter permease n=1 Tax=Bifidobacterium tibiigranuli TaxID=2172043 RepID=A0A5N6S312_9BIFI|nr:amino acid ABC transporter permease [Bifidobacterium tibiigranuli]KAE8128754.1 amino acid ABC transporter permease [Bifidobacterium tibiigranuli]KAE8128945.1 amino acid ABC transporter permease [Bifidobacterium tibiigranuli]MCI1211365.1 amino acid ABC transporter permease [Bifidobacterium tibiigranuli]MCI1222217.1 amino acid ABC transporter permease [Bifidobacterium tibiigranuli]MCI1233104.1 amino acid ABC transporter permease [Bifidobacterium tibiigranuli]
MTTPLLTSWGQYLPPLLSGLVQSVWLAVAAIVIGLPLAFLFCTMVMSENRLIGALGLVIVEIGRGMPALVILYLVYYGLPRFGISLANVAAAIIALAWNYSCYCSEIIRGGIQSVPRGQIEAGNALGLDSRVTFLRVIVPQGLRSAIPGLLGQSILVFQDTSLAYTIAVPELMKQAYSLGGENYQYLRVFVLTGLVYAAVTLPATWITVWMERRLGKSY